jgi:hypothetical protein
LRQLLEFRVRSADNNGVVYDALTGRFTLACPAHEQTHVRLSAFRRLERLPGAHHPAVYRVEFACGCGAEHPALVSHDELDWAPLGLAERAFVNLMTDRVDDAGAELGDLAARRIGAGEWPWSFFCYPEERPRPVSPSSFVVLSPGEGRLGLAVRCPVCGSLSVNLVSDAHVDVPFWNDARIGVVAHVFAEDALRTLHEFSEQLQSATFDERRLEL